MGTCTFAEDSAGSLAPYWSRLGEQADVFLLVGDLTNFGTRAQARALAAELSLVTVPMVAVMGNHDYHSEEPDEVRRVLESAGVTVLEGAASHASDRPAHARHRGMKGFGGGFPGACGHAFGEPEMKEFMLLTERSAAQLERALGGLDADYRVALTHYSPVKDTLAGERLEIYPFLGAFQLAEAIDRAGAHLAIHGHAHHGVERGVTPRGVPVRNVAMPLLRRPYGLYCLDASGRHAMDTEARESCATSEGE